MDQTGIGVIGVGLMGAMFARVVTELPQARLVGVSDLDTSRAQAVAGPLGATVYADSDELLDQPGLDAVIIATSEDQHLAPAQAAARRRKHILIEKPLAGTLEESREIVRLAREAGVHLMVGHTLRFDPVFILARDAVARGDIGELVHAYTRRETSVIHGRKYGPRTTVGYFLGVHDLDALRFVTGREITSVFARGARIVLTDLDVDDVVMASLRFDNGAIGTTQVSWYLPACGDRSRSCLFDLFGTGGRIHLEPYSSGMTIYSEAGAWARPTPGYAYEPVAPGIFPSTYRSEVEHFLRCITQGETPIITAEDALIAVALVEAVERSLREGREVPVHP